jgi:hypothetical protein
MTHELSLTVSNIIRIREGQYVLDLNPVHSGTQNSK